MKGSLLFKVTFKLALCYLVSITMFLALCTISDSPKLIGVVVLFIDMLYSLAIINKQILKPLRDLVNVVSPIDFNLNTIDFTKLDNYSYNEDDEIRVLGDKFKDLSEVLVVRVDRANIETYKSEHDGLSGLFNRVKYQRSKEIYSGCSNVCIIYIDVNNLKKMNDIYGHEAGDALIKEAARKLRFWEDIGDCYRMGGDEFMVVVTNRPKSECEELINEWYPTVGCLNRKDDGFKCRMAYGVAYGGMYSDIDELVKEADEKMYHHKVSIKIENGEDPNSR